MSTTGDILRGYTFVAAAGDAGKKPLTFLKEKLAAVPSPFFWTVQLAASSTSTADDIAVTIPVQEGAGSLYELNLVLNTSIIAPVTTTKATNDLDVNLFITAAVVTPTPESSNNNSVIGFIAGAAISRALSTSTR